MNRINIERKYGGMTRGFPAGLDREPLLQWHERGTRPIRGRPPPGRTRRKKISTPIEDVSNATVKREVGLLTV